MASQSVGDGQAYTVAVIRQSDKTTVGHTSYNLAPTVSLFGQRLLESEPRSGALDMGWKSRALTDSTDVNICRPCQRRVLNNYALCSNKLTIRNSQAFGTYYVIKHFTDVLRCTFP